jgi:hypothetical protein
MNVSGAPDDGIALFVAMPERHLLSVSELGRTEVVLPLGRLGDVPRAPGGCRVYCVALDADGHAQPAATWRATFVGWRTPSPGDDEPVGLPPTWLEDRAAVDDDPGARSDVTETLEPEDDDDDDDDDDPDRPRQVFVTVGELTSLERREWVFGNEVVPKQRRGARSFVPMTPALVRLPD